MEKYDIEFYDNDSDCLLYSETNLEIDDAKDLVERIIRKFDSGKNTGYEDLDELDIKLKKKG